MKLNEKYKFLGPCDSADKYLSQFEDEQEAWEKCKIGSFMIWTLSKLDRRRYSEILLKYLNIVPKTGNESYNKLFEKAKMYLELYLTNQISKELVEVNLECLYDEAVKERKDEVLLRYFFTAYDSVCNVSSYWSAIPYVYPELEEPLSKIIRKEIPLVKGIIDELLAQSGKE